MCRSRIELTGRCPDEINSLGANEARHLFLLKFFTSLSKILYPDQLSYLYSSAEAWMTLPHTNILWQKLKEAIKNIYDHNGGWGYAEFELLPDDEVNYIIGNLNNPTPETNEHLPDSKVNYGVGLDYMASFDDVKLDIASGYVYRGTFRIPR